MGFRGAPPPKETPGVGLAPPEAASHTHTALTTFYYRFSPGFLLHESKVFWQE